MSTRYLTILVAIVVGLAASAWGLSQMAWPTASPFAWASLRRYAAFLVLGFVLIELLARWRGVNRIAAGIIVVCVVAVLAGAIWPLLVAVWIALSAYLVGRALLRMLKVHPDGLSTMTPLLVGAAGYGTAVGLAAHFPINYPGLYGLALAVPVVLGWRTLVEVLVSLRHCLMQGPEPGTRWHDLAIALLALIHFSVALMPEVGHDALAMHLFIPGHLASQHVWGFDVNAYVWAVMPMLGDWLYAIGYMLAGETAARLINVGFIFVLCWLIRDLVIWAGGTAIGARWAVLLFLTTPLTFTESSSLFIESIWAAFAVAGSLSLFRLIQTGSESGSETGVEGDKRAQLMLAGLLLGAALAAKAITLTILPVLLLLLVFGYRRWVQRSLFAALAIGLLLFFAIGAIPYVTAWLLTGNPVFPFFNQLFQSPYYPAVNFDSASIFGKGLSWDILYQVTFHTGRFLESRPGAAGFQWLLLLLPAFLIAIFSRQYRALTIFLVAGLAITMAFQSVSYLRYVFPSFVLVAAGIGVALSGGAKDLIFPRKLLIVVAWSAVALNLVFFRSGTSYGDLSIAPLLSQSGRESYLHNRLPIRNAVALVNRLNPGRSPVAVFSFPLTGGLAADALYPNWYNHQFQARVSEATSADAMAQLLLERGVEYILLDPNWGTPDKRKLVESASELVSEQGYVSVRRLKGSYQFLVELLQNPDFSSHQGWTLPPELLDQGAGKIIVSVASPASQLVPVSGGRRYRNTVIAACSDRPGPGRVQVNWLDAKSRFISTDIRTFDCSPSEAAHVMEVTAPRDAAAAVVYATSHTDIPIAFIGVSFKQ